MLNRFFRKSHRDIIGLLLDKQGIAMLHLSMQGKKPDVKDYQYFPIAQEDYPQEAFDDLEKYVEKNKLKGASCCVVLPDDEYQILSVEAPPVEIDEMREAVKWKVKDLINLSIDEVIVDVFLQEKKMSQGTVIANAVVVPKDIIQSIETYIQGTTLKLMAIDVREFAYRNYIEHSDYHAKCVAIVQITENSGKLIIIHQSHVLFFRKFSIPYKGGFLDDLPEAEIALELQRSLDYYERQLKQLMPALIILVGENVRKDKVTSELTESVNQEVIVIDSLENYSLDTEEQIAPEAFVLSYGVALRKGLLA